MFNSINFKKMTTKVNFKNSVIALAIGLTVASCGGRGGNQQSGTATTETAKVETKAVQADVVISPQTKAEDYTAGALAKMKSLGKTEKDKRVVTAEINKADRTTYEVYTYENGKCTDYSEYVFYTTKADKSDFDYDKTRAKVGEEGEEINEADLWFRVVWEPSDRDWERQYDFAKRIAIDDPNFKVIE
jgi:hypothetical protein